MNANRPVFEDNIIFLPNLTWVIWLDGFIHSRQRNGICVCSIKLFSLQRLWGFKCLKLLFNDCLKRSWLVLKRQFMIFIIMIANCLNRDWNNWFVFCSEKSPSTFFFYVWKLVSSITSALHEAFLSLPVRYMRLEGKVQSKIMENNYFNLITAKE